MKRIRSFRRYRITKRDKFSVRYRKTQNGVVLWKTSLKCYTLYSAGLDTTTQNSLYLWKHLLLYRVFSWIWLSRIPSRRHWDKNLKFSFWELVDGFHNWSNFRIDFTSSFSVNDINSSLLLNLGMAMLEFPLLFWTVCYRVFLWIGAIFYVRSLWPTTTIIHT